MTDRMRQLIERAYELFAPYKATLPLDACTFCCLTDAEANALAVVEPRELSYDLLYNYQTAAKVEILNPNGYKHFLPRIIELTAQWQPPTHSIELALQEVGRFTREVWTDEEYELLIEFVTELFVMCLSINPSNSIHFDSDAIIVMVWYAKLDLQPLLNVWLATDSVSALLHFKDLLMHSRDEFNYHQMKNPFAKGAELPNFFDNWLATKRVRGIFKDRIERLIVNGTDVVDDIGLAELNICYEILSV